MGTKIGEMKKAETIVEEILEQYPRTRTSDQLLYRAYHFKLAKDWNLKVDFATFFTYPERYNACNFATIERVRRKLQHYRPELANIETKLNREYLQEAFKGYAKEEIQC